MFRPPWACPCSRPVCFPRLQSTLLGLQAALQGAGPELPALPRPKPLRFRFLGTPQRRRLICACRFDPSPADAAQAARSLTSALSRVRCALFPPGSRPQFLGAPVGCALCLFWGFYRWLRPSWQMSTIQNLRILWFETGSLFAVWWGTPSLGPSLPLSPPPCLLPLAGDGPVHSRLALLWYSLSPLFWEWADSAEV